MSWGMTLQRISTGNRWVHEGAKKALKGQCLGLGLGYINARVATRLNLQFPLHPLAASPAGALGEIGQHALKSYLREDSVYQKILEKTALGVKSLFIVSAQISAIYLNGRTLKIINASMSIFLIAIVVSSYFINNFLEKRVKDSCAEKPMNYMNFILVIKGATNGEVKRFINITPSDDLSESSLLLKKHFIGSNYWLNFPQDLALVQLALKQLFSAMPKTMLQDCIRSMQPLELAKEVKDSSQIHRRIMLKLIETLGYLYESFFSHQPFCTFIVEWNPDPSLISNEELMYWVKNYHEEFAQYDGFSLTLKGRQI
jgi:hypothetical protein